MFLSITTFFGTLYTAIHVEKVKYLAKDTVAVTASLICAVCYLSNVVDYPFEFA